MPKQKLSPDEITKIKGFIRTYDQIGVDLEKYSEELDNLEKTKTEIQEKVRNLVNQLEECRKEDEEMKKSLIGKYGEFKLSLETFDIETT